jgi:hypothetical protein
MTDTKIPETPAGPSSPLGHPDGASSPGEPQSGQDGASPGPPGKPFCISPWVLWFLGKAVRADYQHKVSSLNGYLTEYLKNTKHLSEKDRLQISEQPPSFYGLPGTFWLIRDLAQLQPDENDRASSGPEACQGDAGQRRKQLPPSLELMNAYQAWETVFNRFIWAIACLVAFPLWPICAVAASVLVGTSPPLSVEIAYICILAVFVGKVFAAYLRIKERKSIWNWKRDNRRRLFRMLLGLSDEQPTSSGEGPTSPSEQPTSSGEEPAQSDEWPVTPNWLLGLLNLLKPLRSVSWLLRQLKLLMGFRAPSWLLRLLNLLIDLGVVAVSGWLLYGALSKLGLLEVIGALLLSMLGTLIVAAAAVFLVLIAESNTGSVRMAAVAVYLAGAAALVLATRLGHLGWPPWLVQDTGSAIWASLSLMGVLAFVSLICYLARVSLWHRKNRRHVVEELIQTLIWLGQRLEKYKKISDLSKLHLFEDLEYTAGLIQNYLPRKLRTQDPASDSKAAEQCRGIAASFRELKQEIALNQSMSRDEIAGRIVPVVGPIFHGDWDKIPSASQVSASSRLKHTARGLSQILIAVVPLAALLVLKDLGIANSTVFAQALPIVVTWLIVSVLTWIDPRAESSISSVSSILGTLGK